MALSAIALCSRALLKVGARPIASFEDDSAEAEVAANLYGSTRDALLSAHPWNFATAQATLPRLEASPVADYAYAFQLPPDFLRALSAGPTGNGRGLRYRIAERKLHAPTDTVVLTYIFRPPEAAVPPFVDQVLIAWLAAELCIPITESTSRAEMLRRLAEDELKRARQIDSQQDTPAAIEDWPLIAVRA